MALLTFPVLHGLSWLYFLPSFIGIRRTPEQGIRLLVANALFGWTLIGWLSCLLWTMMARASAEVRRLQVKFKAVLVWALAELSVVVAGAGLAMLSMARQDKKGYDAPGWILLLLAFILLAPAYRKWNRIQTA